MKKFLAIALAAVLLFALAACAGNKTTDGNATAGNATAGNATDGNADKTLTMATNAEFPPYEFYSGEEIVGIDAEVAALIAEKLGMELEIVDIAFDSIIPGVQSGKYDMGMAGLTITEDRLEKVSFSTSYATGVQSVIVKEDGAVQSLDDIAGKMIGVQTTTTGDIYASKEYGEDFVTKFDNGAAAVQALLAGKVDCVIIDNEPAKSYVAANEGLKILETSYTVEDYAICFAKDNTELQSKVNAALEELIADGSVQAVIDKYIPAE